MKEVNYYFRNVRAGYSIQTVFRTVAERVGRTVPVRRTYLPSPFAGPLSVLRNGLYALRRQRRGGLNHITGDVHYLLWFLRGRRTVVTVHDIMYFHQLSGLKRRLWRWLYIAPLRRAACVVFISDLARREVLEQVGLPAERVRVIPNPVDDRFRFSEKPFCDACPVILHVGTLGRKNLERTVRALEGIPCQLRIIGNLSADTERLLREKRVNYSCAHDLDDGQMAEEYRRADIVSFPSLSEGFGMPVIEGQAVGRVVVTSDLSPMREVAGGAAALVDPYSVDDMRRAYLRVIRDRDYRGALVRKGRENVLRYSPDAVARQYVEIYRNLSE